MLYRARAACGWSPILWALDTSFKAEPDTIKIPVSWAIPHFSFSAYSLDFSATDIARWYINSAIVAVFVTVLTVLTASMAGYALSRQQFRGKRLIYAAILAGIMIPPQALMVPLFREFQAVHGLNTYWALILPQVPVPIAVFIFKKFFDGQPAELDQAARVDGASWWTCYRRIALPLARPAVAAVAIFTFVWTWNNFLWPFLAATNTTMMTIPVGLGTVVSGTGITNALTHGFGGAGGAAGRARLPTLAAELHRAECSPGARSAEPDRLRRTSSTNEDPKCHRSACRT